ncbi:hypothetical protein K458DRAFT_171104 [Lentithecium fluviatile CBS 122367]|uniref:Uncharacterized protein n=1 Tax=Lentithecium fluviatile CBS 122367 TaxID=1168545 RepID=A0A6G1JCH4_9PLEO|nr:hypothetical protein K458DRAFT_171104 [Lentithecium fluviatile CBS 122367]
MSYSNPNLAPNNLSWHPPPNYSRKLQCIARTIARLINPQQLVASDASSCTLIHIRAAQQLPHPRTRVSDAGSDGQVSYLAFIVTRPRVARSVQILCFGEVWAIFSTRVFCSGGLLDRGAVFLGVVCVGEPGGRYEMHVSLFRRRFCRPVLATVGSFGYEAPRRAIEPGGGH